MKKKSLGLLMGAAVAIMVVGCGDTENVDQAEVVNSAEEQLVEVVEEEVAKADAVVESSEEVYSEVTIYNYDLTTTYTQKPEKVVCLSLNSAEIIAALGEADSILAIQNGNNTVEDLLPEYASVLKDVDIPDSINTGMPPTLEAMLELSPDLIVMNAYYFNVPFFGTLEDYQNNDMNLYVTESFMFSCKHHSLLKRKGTDPICTESSQMTPIGL